MLSCIPGAGLVDAPGDCDDGDPAIHPEGTEVCPEGVRADDDCDGLVDWRDPDSPTGCAFVPTAIAISGYFAIDAQQGEAVSFNYDGTSLPPTIVLDLYDDAGLEGDLLLGHCTIALSWDDPAGLPLVAWDDTSTGSTLHVVGFDLPVALGAVTSDCPDDEELMGLLPTGLALHELTDEARDAIVDAGEDPEGFGGAGGVYGPAGTGALLFAVDAAMGVEVDGSFTVTSLDTFVPATDGTYPDALTTSRAYFVVAVGTLSLLP